MPLTEKLITYYTKFFDDTLAEQRGDKKASSMEKVKLKPNTIVHFKGAYIDDNNKPAKERRHVILEVKGDEVFFLKLTSENKEKDLYARRIGQTDC